MLDTHPIFRRLTKKLEFTNMKKCNRPSKTRINFSFYASWDQREPVSMWQNNQVIWFSLEISGQEGWWTWPMGKTKARTGQRARAACPGNSALYLQLVLPTLLFQKPSILTGRNPKENSNKLLTTLSTETKSQQCCLRWSHLVRAQTEVLPQTC